MTEPSISLQNVHLHYAASAFKERSVKTLLNSLLSRRHVGAKMEDIHALKGISVDISRGERVALIGHNGAGKSTFLKTIAGLYPISSGTSKVTGTVRSLFDIGLGFEPDATGRENILYRGLLLGLTPRFMREIENEIVEFADLGEFIDYPIKTYSAGMQVRLAFAISTAVEGDILLLDEVIGAGDAAFMTKAKARIMGMVEKAEIMVLASHDLANIRQLCTRALVFKAGRIAFDGAVEEGIVFYNTGAGVKS
jgi:lipopolysaccharide transport system ATP-binding protein